MDQESFLALRLREEDAPAIGLSKVRDIQKSLPSTTDLSIELDKAVEDVMPPLMAVKPDHQAGAGSSNGDMLVLGSDTDRSF